MLIPYYTTRLECVFCGTFEIGTKDRPDPAARCPWCDEDVETIAQCRGETSRPLPFTTDPRAEEEVRGTSISTVNKYRHNTKGNSKATGRKRSADEESQRINRERYLAKLEKKRKQRSDAQDYPPTDIRNEPKRRSGANEVRGLLAS